MKFIRPRKLLSGFHCDEPDPQIPCLTHLGEQWVSADWAVSWHEHHTWECYLQVEGKSIWEIQSEKQYALEPGSLLAVAPGLSHRLIHSSPSHHYIFAGMNIPKFLHKLRASEELSRFWTRSDSLCSLNASTILPAFRQLIREASILLPYRTEGIRSAMQSLILEATRVFQTVQEKPLVSIHHPAVAHAKHLLESQPAESWKLSDLAKLSGVSAHHLVELFSQELGISPHQYLIKRRVEMAKSLLNNSDLSITQIALETGFASSQHFSKMFRQTTGRSPIYSRRRSKSKISRFSHGMNRK